MRGIMRGEGSMLIIYGYWRGISRHIRLKSGVVVLVHKTPTFPMIISQNRRFANFFFLDMCDILVLENRW